MEAHNQEMTNVREQTKNLTGKVQEISGTIGDVTGEFRQMDK